MTAVWTALILALAWLGDRLGDKVRGYRTSKHTADLKHAKEMAAITAAAKEGTT